MPRVKTAAQAGLAVNAIHGEFAGLRGGGGFWRRCRRGVPTAQTTDESRSSAQD